MSDKTRASSPTERTARLRREQEFFTRLAADEQGLSWAERSAVARPRQEMRGALLRAAAEVGTGAGQRVLDVGCGTGAYTLPFARSTKATVVAVDATPALLSRARRRLPTNVSLAAADANSLPFRDATFDAVVGNAILHHLPLDVAVPELLRVLRPGGRFCFTEPNLVNPHMYLILKVPWLRRRVDASPDETAFVRWRLRRTLEGFGLRSVSIRPFDFIYPATPTPLIAVVQSLGRILERTPLVREIAGSLLITGRKAG